MSINSETDKLRVEYLYNEILQSSEMSKLLLHERANINKLQNYNSEQKKPDAK